MSHLVPLVFAAGALALLQPPEVPAPRAVAPPSAGAEVAPHPRPAAPREALPRRHALVLCGHPGDAAHAKTFTETVGKLGEGLARTAGIPAERQYVVFGSEAPKGVPGATGPATKEAVAAAVADVRKKLRPEDGLWVIVLGHGHHDGRQAFWCLPGPDLSAAEFGKLFAEVTCREQVFVMTASLSGYFVNPLAKRDRVVIAATETDAETNETTFPAVFAQLLGTGLNATEHDFDKDGRLTLFDLYVAVAKEIAQNYAGADQVSTEHAQLDDDGDGVGHEVQGPFLPADQGGTPPGQKAKRPHRDGARAAQIPLAR
ncbi:Uncharacterized protein OS=Gemmatimonas aurantiaca (strain T-27 / DSM 14586 / JCM 11422 / NBRC 100505) GN=GAU_3098 PE=4 SV=1 [Gemmata massiliana]|uniref:EF-hand domain-containing protein n=1 Tax=Gemmata massiliana TaxID=1210884 RepID=A0A6P2D6U4_9BACT|nr:hypothetical protein [Gemmata massiliana]VTR96176.1 Uncharacterized protein OS=Gemmatimonas aurantiaca (strain T-27 / DSM 14586 / JCM 11422 / NBRC 100505) GN=GAU_3098 PE=4 SV=1 [Gemmata massiliana]